MFKKSPKIGQRLKLNNTTPAHQIIQNSSLNICYIACISDFAYIDGLYLFQFLLNNYKYLQIPISLSTLRKPLFNQTGLIQMPPQKKTLLYKMVYRYILKIPTTMIIKILNHVASPRSFLFRN